MLDDVSNNNNHNINSHHHYIMHIFICFLFIYLLSLSSELHISHSALSATGLKALLRKTKVEVTNAKKKLRHKT